MSDAALPRAVTNLPPAMAAENMNEVYQTGVGVGMTTYTYKPAGLTAVMTSRFMIGEMHRRATAGRVYALHIAPIVTGRYVGSFRVASGIKNGKAWARLYNTAHAEPSEKWPQGFYYAVALEFGQRYTTSTGKLVIVRRQRIIGRAVDAIRAA